MPQRPQEYYRPTDLAEAIKLLALPDAAPLGGGTRLLAGDVSAKIIVDLQALGLSGIDLLDNQLRIGATTTLATLYDAGEISGGACELLRQAIMAAGPNTFRNAATLGGVVGSREPSSELLALLLVLDAYLLLAGETVSEMPLADYLAPDERPKGLITQIVIPWGEGKGGIARVGRTPADDPIVAVAAWQPTGQSTRLAAVGISARPVRLPNAPSPLTEAKITAAAAEAQESVTHPGDFLGSTEYRRAMAGVLTRRALQACLV